MAIFKGLRGQAALERHGEATREPPRAVRFRDALIVALTLTTGALDAVSYLRLGQVFSSVITGNLALLGVAAAQHDAMLALNAGLALAGYACGVLVGGALAGTPERGQPAWPVKVSVTLAVEWCVLAAFGGEWLAAGSHPAGASRLVLLPLGAAAMGMQSTAVRRLGQMSTTYDQYPDRHPHGAGDPPVACAMAAQHRGHSRRRRWRNPRRLGRSAVPRLGPRRHSHPDHRCPGKLSQPGPARLTSRIPRAPRPQAGEHILPGRAPGTTAGHDQGQGRGNGLVKESGDHRRARQSVGL